MRIVRIAIAILLTMVLFIDSRYMMVSRVDGKVWQSREDEDYQVVGKAVLGKGEYALKGDTLELLAGLKSGRQFRIKYCIFDNLWIESLDTKETAWYVGKMD